MQTLISRCDPETKWINYRGEIPHNDLLKFYKSADLGVFASSCETFGIILLESMGAGLPIACSNQGALKEILGDGGVYFDPSSPLSIAESLQTLMESASMREEKSRNSFNRAQQFSWDQCSFDTFEFISSVATMSSK